MLQKHKNKAFMLNECLNTKRTVLAQQTEIMGQFKTFRGDSVISTIPEITPRYIHYVGQAFTRKMVSLQFHLGSGSLRQ